MSFVKYLKSLLKFTISSALTVGILACILILLVGEMSMNFEVGLEIEPVDGLWVLLGLPVMAILLLAATAPVSFFVYRLFWGRGRES
jgi:hypothetical protein